MSETKTYVFPESGGNGGGSGMLAMLAPLLQQKGIDPNLLVAMQGKNNNGFGGDGKVACVISVIPPTDMLRRSIRHLCWSHL